MGMCLEVVKNSLYDKDATLCLRDLATAGWLYNDNMKLSFSPRGHCFWRECLILSQGDRNGLWFYYGEDKNGVLGKGGNLCDNVERYKKSKLKSP